MSGSFEGKSILVTGGASGIGRAAAIRFAQEGGRVCVADLNIDGARAVASEIGGEAIAVQVDVASAHGNEAMTALVVARFGGLDIALLNAGYLGPMDGFAAADEALFDRHVAINLKGAFLGLKAVEKVIRPEGAVVVTASTAGVIGLAESPCYTAAKHGVVGLVKASAPAFAARGARINALCPGGVATPMMGGADQPIVSPNDLERVPLRGMGSAQQVAEVALWLASPAACFVNGHAHIADGGLLSTFVPSPVGP
ncbi:SDR family oxidoreductase [Sphingobium sp. WCS2017Hpa-17]|uniref:SDR family NAD(P)-dependent oxidoreductase n=1 Tax=Sphingobium sp. WCS2017Hpa-17 TaxID=3073638 RepID=UPI00288BBB6C|nr:SDR family oxidoreductase [Sphingobium sp. WCS2017Hpa-17]